MAMRTNKVPGERVINGSFIEMWWDGELCYEIQSITADITPERENINMAGNMETDTKMIGMNGEGTFVLKHVYSRGATKLFEQYKQGKDVASQIIVKIADPDAYGTERFVLNRVKFGKLPLINSELRKMGDKEYPFTFSVSESNIIESIAVQEG